ncbi:M23 family metallopeptidase [Lacibacter luteus]|nr:M23 family metallopeptidase [Lacibacter luteus]
MYKPTLYLIATCCILFLFSSCAVNKSAEAVRFRALQKGKIKDDSSYVYSLPFAVADKHRLVQGYFSRFTHRNRAALDFKMKKGTAIYAARGGVVMRVKEDGDKGGLDGHYRQYGNNIIINHNDSTRSGYWHLQYNGAVVNVGDTVQQGQLIGYSGNTGYTAFPHLHFIVWRSERGNWRQIGTRFQTRKGAKYLRPFKKYKRLK